MAFVVKRRSARKRAGEVGELNAEAHLEFPISPEQQLQGVRGGTCHLFAIFVIHSLHEE